MCQSLSFVTVCYKFQNWSCVKLVSDAYIAQYAFPPTGFGCGLDRLALHLVAALGL